MKQSVKITDEKEYNKLLELFKNALYEKIPYHENCLIQFTRPSDPRLLMQYSVECGPSFVVCELQTESSGKDSYLIYLNGNNEAQFIYIREVK